MTKAQAQESIIKVRAYKVSNWDNAEDEYCRKWFASSWLGQGMILCNYCKESAVEFRGYIADHVCAECEASLKQLHIKE